MKTTPKLYALLVGINRYENVRHLNACIADVERVNNYLQKWTTKEKIVYQPLLLTDNNAKKENVINGFRKHLCLANSNDVVIFYFSGHGGQEDASQVFHDVEYDKKLETIVCHDSRNGKTTDLADKELRYLIHEVAQNKPHIFTVFDCCHAGTNTRHPVKRLSGYSSRRDWSQFIFSDKYKTEQDFINAGGTNKALPEGNHIQIAACEDLELAYEYQGSGVFTKAFLQVLTDTQGTISYYSLRNRIKYSINRFSSFSQSPQIYVKGNQSDIFQNFLLGSNTAPKESVNIIFKSKTKRWIVDVGAIHGLGSLENNYFPIEIYENEKCVAKAFPDVVHFGYALLTFEDGQSNLDRQKQYTASIEHLFSTNTRIHLNIETPTLKQKIIDYFEKNKAEGIEWINADEAHFAIFEKENQLLITYPNDKKPLVKPLKQHLLKPLLSYYHHIAKWQFVKDVSPILKIKSNPIDIQIYRNGVLQNIEDGILTLEYDKLPPNASSLNTIPTGQFTMHIKNNHRSPLYFALVGLCEQFGIYPNVLSDQMVRIKSEESIEEIIELDYQLYIDADGWEYTTTFLKIFAVPNEVDISLLAQDGLPFPSEQTTRKIKRRSDKALKPKEWFTRILEVRVVMGWSAMG